MKLVGCVTMLFVFNVEGGLMCETQRTVEDRRAPAYEDPCIRAENEDDDGYDPYSDRRPDPEPLFECDPWA